MTRQMLPICVLLALLLSACRSSGELRYLQRLAAPVSNQAVVSLKVIAKTEDLEDSDVSEVIQRFQNQLYDSLLSQNIFTQVVVLGQASHYTLLVDLSGIELSRFLIGVFTGPNKLVATVSLLENATGRQIAQFVVVGKSASHPFSTEAGMSDAIREVVAKVVLGLKK